MRPGKESTTIQGRYDRVRIVRPGETVTISYGRHGQSRKPQPTVNKRGKRERMRKLQLYGRCDHAKRAQSYKEGATGQGRHNQAKQAQQRIPGVEGAIMREVRSQEGTIGFELEASPRRALWTDAQGATTSD